MKNSIYHLVAIVIIVFLATLSFASADRYIIHEPTSTGLQESTAVELGSRFIDTSVGFPDGTILANSDTNISYGPGWQWGADTEEDCWSIEYIGKNDMSIYAVVVIDPTTSKVLSWEFTNYSSGITYIDKVPLESADFSVEKASHIVITDISRLFSVSEDNVKTKIALGICYGPTSKLPIKIKCNSEYVYYIVCSGKLNSANVYTEYVLNSQTGIIEYMSIHYN